MESILIVCHDYYMSGANMALFDWIRNIKSKKYNLIILLPRYNKEVKELFEKNGCEVIIGNFVIALKKLSKGTMKSNIKEIIKLILSYTLNKIQKYRLKVALKNKNVVLIHSNSFAVTLGCELAMHMNIPHVWHIREFMKEDHQIQHYNMKKIDKLCEYSHAIFISNVVKEYYKKVNFKTKNIIYDNVFYKNDYKKNRKFMEDGKCNILLAGTLTENKGQLEAIKALEKITKLKEINLMICGKGPSQEQLKRYVDKNNLKNIKFLGHVVELEDIRKQVDIALNCSNKEAFGRITIEAMYYENLIIASNTGCNVELVGKNNYGYLYEKGNIQDLANKIIYAIENVIEVEQIVHNAKEYAIANYNVNISNKIFELYLDILRKDVHHERKS